MNLAICVRGGAGHSSMQVGATMASMLSWATSLLVLFALSTIGYSKPNIGEVNSTSAIDVSGCGVSSKEY